MRGPSARISPGPEGHRLCRGRQRGDRIPLGRESNRSAAGTGGRSGSPTGRRDRRDRRSAAALAAKAATTTIPIVFIVGDDPVRLGLVASLTRPGGNLTGINFLSAELAAKRLELLHELVPAAARIAVLVNPTNAAMPRPPLRDVEAAARAMGLQIQVLNASTSREIDAAFATLVRERPDALFVGSDAFFTSRRVQLVHLASRHAIPAIYCAARICRSRRADELRSQHRGCVSSGRRLYRPHPQGREAGRPAGGAADQVRVGHQPARPPRRSASPCRRRCSPSPTR